MRRSVMPEAVKHEQAVPQQQQEEKTVLRPATAEPDVIADLVVQRKQKLQDLKVNRRQKRQKRPQTIVFPGHGPTSPAGLDLSMTVQSVGKTRRR